MHRFTRQGVVNAQPHQVFDFVTDQSKISLWSPEVVSSVVAGGGPVQQGSRLIQRRKQGKREMTNEVEVTAHDRPKSHAVRTRILGVEMHFTFSFWPEGSGTKVTFDCTCEGRGLAKLWAGKMAKLVEAADDQRIERLKAAMDRGGR
jgi:carbon monoxide dehydrogenase subunit G